MDAEKQTGYLVHPVSGTPVYAIAENVREAFKEGDALSLTL